MDQSEQNSSYLSILKRVGKVLIIIGVVDIGVMIYCIVNRISYSSSFNIFAVIAGIFLLRGSLRSAAIVTWMAAFFGAACVGMPIAVALILPIDLTLLQARLEPLNFFSSTLMWLFISALLYWVVKQLHSEPVLQ